MPWEKLSDLPVKIKRTFRKKDYSPKQKRVWLKVFNKSFDRYNGDEARSFSAAWSVANKLGFKEWLNSQ